MKKLLAVAISILTISLLTGCDTDIEIIERPDKTEAEYVSDNKISADKYYVKKGTKFAEVYKPLGNVSSEARQVNGKRVFYMQTDQPFIPEHYKGEIVAYKSPSASLSSVSLERYKDMGYSFGIFGGTLEDDGYYHISAKNNLCANSEAEEIFKRLYSSEVRIATVGNIAVSKLVDKESGIITGLEKDQTYLVELYTGTEWKRIYFKADTQFLKSFELYGYGPESISDTKNGYMCFKTPETLKSGYYFINGKGLFLYHEYTMDEYEEDESLNESSFNSVAESIASYSQEFVVSVPYDTKNVLITAKTLKLDKDASGKVISPNGTIYEMDVDKESNELSLSLSVAQAGEWIVYIPQYITVTKVNAENEGLVEETVCKSQHFSYEEGASYQRFYVPVSGNGNVYATLIREGDARTFLLLEDTEKTDFGKKRFLYLNMPYLEAGEYDLNVYFYQSTTEVGSISVSDYVDSSSDIYIIGD